MHNLVLDDILEDFELLDDWEDRYRYVIELGRSLPPLIEADRSSKNKVQGCVSQVWLKTNYNREAGNGLTLFFQGDSDAMIVKGLIAILIAIFSGRTAAEIVDIDAQSIFKKMELQEHLTAQRSNGLASMVSRIRSDARQLLKANVS